MDPRLAELYGTNEMDESDIEKLAAAELAEELTDGEEMDLDGIDEDDIEALAASVLEDEEGEEVDEEDGQEKLAEADFLGRVMAHSYVQEMREIEKTASDSQLGDTIPGAGKKSRKPHKGGGKKGGKGVMAKIKGQAGKAWGATKRGASAYGNLMAGGFKKGKKPGFMNRLKGASGKRLKVWGARGGTAAALGAAGYGAKKLMEKRSSALETLAEQRAMEILEASGVEDDASPYDVLAASVEERAAEILAENGYELE